MSGRRIRVLIVEDQQTDAELILRELRRAGFEPESARVETEPQYATQLDREWDIVLSDYELPQFNGLRALELLNGHRSDVPFVLISGTIGEETAVELMKRGASDYILKDRLGRLGAVVSQALAETQLRKQKEQAAQELRASEERFRQVVENIEEVFWMADLEQNRLLFVSAAYEGTWGRSREALYQNRSDWFEGIHPEDRERVREASKQHQVAGPYSESYRVVRPDGSIRWIHDRGFPIRDERGKVYRVAGVAQDITERKLAHEAQLAAEAQFRFIVEHSLVGIYVICDDRLVYVNPRMAEILGYSAEELKSRPVVDFIVPADREKALENVREGLAREVDSIRYSLRMLRPDGSIVHVEVHGARTRYAGRRAIMGTLLDTTERREAEQRVEAQLSRVHLLNQITRAISEREDLRSIFLVAVTDIEEHLPVDFCCVCLHDSAAHSLRVAAMNPRNAELAAKLGMTGQGELGIDPASIRQCMQGRLIYEPDVTQHATQIGGRFACADLCALVLAPLSANGEVFGVLCAARQKAHSFASSDCEFLRQVSEHVALAAHQARLHEALQRAYDDLRQTQEAILQQERLRALGQMASGIAHDINNAISPVAIYTDLILRLEPNLSVQSREFLETIQRAVEDVAHTVARLREFYRAREPQTEFLPLSLSRMAKEVADLTRARWSDMPQERGVVVELRMELAPELPAIDGIESEIREALTNLVFNAVDAMPEGGTLTLRTGIMAAPSAVGDIAASSRAYVEVADTGTGMDEETRQRCLEPFFTTKGERGTGLGLAMVCGVAQRHDAEIEIESAPGRGTVVRLSFRLPLAPTSPRATAAPKPAVSPLRVLIVDDDPLIIKALQFGLEIDGHSIMSARGGREGIEAFLAAAERDEPFQMVITDLGMPKVDGRAVANAVKTVSPQTPVILLTGWGQRLAETGDIPPHVDSVLSKPPQLRDLREAIASLWSKLSHSD